MKKTMLLVCALAGAAPAQSKVKRAYEAPVEARNLDFYKFMLASLNSNFMRARDTAWLQLPLLGAPDHLRQVIEWRIAADFEASFTPLKDALTKRPDIEWQTLVPMLTDQCKQISRLSFQLESIVKEGLAEARTDKKKRKTVDGVISAVHGDLAQALELNTKLMRYLREHKTWPGPKTAAEVALPNGTWTRWHAADIKAEEGVLRQGVRDGIWKRWYASGSQEMEFGFKNGLRSGVWTYWDEKGKVTKTETYKDGKLAK